MIFIESESSRSDLEFRQLSGLYFFSSSNINEKRQFASSFELKSNKDKHIYNVLELEKIKCHICEGDSKSPQLKCTGPLIHWTVFAYFSINILEPLWKDVWGNNV